MSGNAVSASRQIETSTALVSAASAPPFRHTALPDFSAREEIWGTTSGRDSNTTPTTPSGHVSLCRTRSSSSSIVESRRCSGSGRRATSRTRAAISAMPRSVVRRRANIARESSPRSTACCAAAQSFSFAARISAARASMAFAAASSASFRRSPESVARTCAARARAPDRCCRTFRNFRVVFARRSFAIQ